jgi:hypothetical protein
MAVCLLSVALGSPLTLPSPPRAAAFFDHELFHLYHRQVVGADAPHDNEPAWWTMWMEGLATYVSQRMNPGLDAWFLVSKSVEGLPERAGSLRRTLAWTTLGPTTYSRSRGPASRR